MLKTGVILENGKRLRAPSPVSDFMLGWGPADLELQTRAVEKALHQGEVRLVGSSARPEVMERA